MKKRPLFLLLIAFALLCWNAVILIAGRDPVIEEGKKVKMSYSISTDGKEVDSSANKPPLDFVFGEPGLLPSLQQNVKGLKTGDKKKFTVGPKDGFGEPDPKAVVEVPRANFKDEKIEKGMIFSTPGKNGMPLKGVIQEVKKDVVVIDFNHPLAGKTVTFDVEILEVK